jgi:hypothetical protein
MAGAHESLRNKILTSNVEHLSTMRIAMYYNTGIIDVVNKLYDGETIKDTRFAHFIIANNETGIIYKTVIDYLTKNRAQIPIISADTIQCLGKTKLVDYELFDIFTFTSQKLFCEPGISGFIFNTDRVPIADPTMMLSQHLCENLISSIEYIKQQPNPDEFFKDLYDYTFTKIREICALKELRVVIVVNDVDTYRNFDTNEQYENLSEFDDETVVIIVY